MSGAGARPSVQRLEGDMPQPAAVRENIASAGSLWRLQKTRNAPCVIEVVVTSVTEVIITAWVVAA